MGYSPPPAYRLPAQVYAAYGGLYLPAILAGHAISLPGGVGGNINPIPSLNPIFWFNGNGPAFSDIAGTTPASIGDRVGLIKETLPLSDSWVADTSGQRGVRASNSIEFFYYGTDPTNNSTPGQSLHRSTTPNVNFSNTTFIATFLPRDIPQSPEQGLIRSGGPKFGIFTANGGVFVDSDALEWATSLSFLSKTARKVSVAVVWSPSGMKAYMYIDGVLTSDSVNVALSGGSTNSPMTIGDAFGSSRGFYGVMSQAVGFNYQLTPSQIMSVIQWTDSQPLPEAFPTGKLFIAVMGDSIPRGVSANMKADYPFQSFGDLRSLYPGCMMFNGAISGGGAGLPNYAPIDPYYSAAHSKNIAMVQVGTNNLANGNTVSDTLVALYAQCDTARAKGYKLALSTILPRSGLLGVTQAQFNAAMTAYNNDILSNGINHADVIINTTGIVGMGAIGDSTNLMNYVDGVHPTSQGHCLLYPTFSTKLQQLAAL